MAQPAPDFDNLFSSFGKPIYRYCLRMTGDAAEAEDLTQDTFVSAMEGWDKFRGDSTVGVWLFRIAHFKARAALRRTSVRRLFKLQPEPKPDPHDHLALAESLLRLPFNQREAFLLVKLQGLTLEEAAQAINVPVGTLKTRVYQAIRSLKVSLSEPYASTNEASHEL